MTMWDDLRRGAQQMLDEGQRLGKVAKLKADERRLEQEIGERLLDLGTRVLELHRRNELHHHELDETFVTINRLQRQLRDLQVELDELSGRGQAAGSATGRRAAEACPDCGGATSDSDRFCRSCGYDLRAG